MATLLLLHGPNLNWLGKRDPRWYGSLTLADIEQAVCAAARQHHYTVLVYQSNHEGALIDYLQLHAAESQGILINPGALAHYSYALYDALVDTSLPIIEVHLSDLAQREAWRSISVTAPACIATITGKGMQGYHEAVARLVQYLTDEQCNTYAHDDRTNST